MNREKIYRRVFIVAVTVFSLLIIGLLFAFIKLDSEVSLREDIRFEVPASTSLSSIVDIYNSHGLLRPKWFFLTFSKAYSKITGQKVCSGFFEIKKGMKNYDVLHVMFSPAKPNTVSITIPEGSGGNYLTALLTDKFGFDSISVITMLRSDSLRKRYAVEGPDLLGYLMPDTYEFYAHEKLEKVIARLAAESADFWTAENKEKARIAGLTKNSVLTLASIVEAETPVKEEMPLVAGLYLNRLKTGMPLQSDPTVQFALGEKKRLTYSDLKTPHPYNTYYVKGLPPGPINNPGRAAIEAVLEPEKHDYIYMVAIFGGGGKHNFSTGLAAHNKFVSEYRKKRKNISG